ncbi:MAG: phenylalanine--tRNA ligase subunit alpha [Deltaproteobacteria bacterium]|nr:phenylalanine--tRNA ligase subunit alpha [Deltaproteobacteria bacterium]MBW2122111.1 phenylalanine--tRNA ligase subunit alpha [Deltaproteobacteria bacterium]
MEEGHLIIERIAHLEEETLSKLKEVETVEALEDWRVKVLGKKSELVRLQRSIGDLPKEERPLVGKRSNLARKRLEEAFESRKEELERLRIDPLLRERIDVTLPGWPVRQGSLHPSTQVLREIHSIFSEMGFQVFDGPEIETDYYNFELLNMPANHPARDMWDTLYISDTLLLRTHTSPGQIRAMKAFCPEPIRVILPGKCYRYEAITARSEVMFHQVEGLAVGRKITMADLKGVLIEFGRKMFGSERKIRFRCSHFPFTEPSVEVDMDCLVCGGAGCSVCKYTGWVEILGAGMVHPKVLENGGYDPEVFSGFAFGMGPERIFMLKYGIDDIRLFFRNDLRFLKQFG